MWIEYQTKKQPGSTFLKIKGNTLAICEDLKEIWKILQKCLHLVQVVTGLAASKTAMISTMLNSGEAESAEVAKTFSIVLRNLIDEEGYTLDQIFNFDETSICWKQILYVPNEET